MNIEECLMAYGDAEFWFKQWRVANTKQGATRSREITSIIIILQGLQGMDANGYEIINAKLQSMKIARPPMKF